MSIASWIAIFVAVFAGVWIPLITTRGRNADKSHSGARGAANKEDRG